MAKRRPTPPAKPVITCSPAWAWFFAGIIIGIIISFVFYLHEIAPNHLPIPPESTVVTSLNTTTQTENLIKLSEQANTQPSTTIQPTEKNNQFEFYDVLPNGGATKKTPLMLPEESSDPSEVIDSAPIQVPGTYLLQIGSFRDARGAEELQTYLATLNIRTYVQQATVKENNGGNVLWHRVMAGPFTDLTLLNQVRNVLATQNLNAIVVNITNH